MSYYVYDGIGSKVDLEVVGGRLFFSSEGVPLISFRVDQFDKFVVERVTSADGVVGGNYVITLDDGGVVTFRFKVLDDLIILWNDIRDLFDRGILGNIRVGNKKERPMQEPTEPTHKLSPRQNCPSKSIEPGSIGKSGRKGLFGKKGN